MDFMPLRLNSSSFTCSICALAAIILQLVAMECQKLHMVDSPIALAVSHVGTVKTMHRYLSSRSWLMNQPLFLTREGKPLTRNYFNCLLREALSKLGFASKFYLSHSFRIGAATTAAAAGPAASLQDWLIRALQRSFSDCYKLYIHIRMPSTTPRSALLSLDSCPTFNLLALDITCCWTLHITAGKCLLSSFSTLCFPLLGPHDSYDAKCQHTFFYFSTDEGVCAASGPSYVMLTIGWAD